MLLILIQLNYFGFTTCLLLFIKTLRSNFGIIYWNDVLELHFAFIFIVIEALFVLITFDSVFSIVFLAIFLKFPIYLFKLLKLSEEKAKKYWKWWETNMHRYKTVSTYTLNCDTEKETETSCIAISILWNYAKNMNIWSNAPFG